MAPFDPATLGPLGPLGPLAEAVQHRLDRMDAEQVTARIWRYDHTVWKPDPTEIANRLGWLTLPTAMRGQVGELQAFARQAAADGFTHALLLGMGGSSLAPEMFARTFGSAAGALDLTVLDTTHPAAIRAVEDALDLSATLFIVASKSGGTLETRSQMEHFWARLGATPTIGDRFVAITDPGTSLDQLATDRGFRAVFRNPTDLGGRYSALSLFGLVPAALIGADLEALLGSAGAMAGELAGDRAAAENPGAWLGAVMGEAARAGRDKLTFVLPAAIDTFGDWVEQLVAESTGKEGKGIVPVPGETLGDPSVYGSDRLFVALGDHPALEPLQAAGHPVVRLEAGSPERLGAEILRFEFATAVAGYVLGINAFDQPNVEEAKQATRDILAAGGAAAAGQVDPGSVAKEGQTGPGDYLGIQAYLQRTPERAAGLQATRLALRDQRHVATTVGFGPRFLHSTGQLHKGGPDTGVFLQVVEDTHAVDLPIPGQPYSFGDLIAAQALGDLQALRARGRRVVRLSPDELSRLG
ncbi:MAG TPA: glucose-6-phosphate isomerase [Actinomycetota bacterium]|nr:glucose-6-phosphate isomerase [Actinomycetota bacterium]